MTIIATIVEGTNDLRLSYDSESTRLVRWLLQPTGDTDALDYSRRGATVDGNSDDSAKFGLDLANALRIIMRKIDHNKRNARKKQDGEST